VPSGWKRNDALEKNEQLKRHLTARCRLIIRSLRVNDTADIEGASGGSFSEFPKNIIYSCILIMYYDLQVAAKSFDGLLVSRRRNLLYD